MRKTHKLAIVLFFSFLTLMYKVQAVENDYSYIHTNYEVPTAMKQQLEEVLKENNGNVLYLNEVDKIDLTDIIPGTQYLYKGTRAHSYSYTFKKVQSDYYYFDLEIDFGGSIGIGKSIFRTNGYTEEVANIDAPKSFDRSPSNENICKFKIGKCEYKAGSKVVVVTTSHDDGIWTTTSELGHVGIAYLIKKRIYDKNGMVIYDGAFSNRWATGKHDYTMRIKN